MKEIYKGSSLQQQEQQRLYVLQLLHFLRAGNLHYCKTKNRKEQNRNYKMIIQKQKKWFSFQQQIKEVTGTHSQEPKTKYLRYTY
jgi:hypothetical protein